MKIEGFDTKEMAQRVADGLRECWYINHFCISYSKAKQSYTLYFYDIDHVPTRTYKGNGVHTQHDVPTQDAEHWSNAPWVNRVYEEMG